MYCISLHIWICCYIGIYTKKNIYSWYEWRKLTGRGRKLRFRPTCPLVLRSLKAICARGAYERQERHAHPASGSLARKTGRLPASGSLPPFECCWCYEKEKERGWHAKRWKKSHCIETIKLIFPSFWGEAVQLRSSWAAGGLCPPNGKKQKKSPGIIQGRGHSPARHRRSSRTPAELYPPIRKKIINEIKQKSKPGSAIHNRHSLAKSGKLWEREAKASAPMPLKDLIKEDWDRYRLIAKNIPI